MKITGEGGVGVVPFQRMASHQLFKGFSDQTKEADAHFLVSVVDLARFVSTSVCWYWIQDSLV